ncbi:hypothetical protein [Kitasatospora sp. NPDC004289]
MSVRQRDRADPVGRISDHEVVIVAPPLSAEALKAAARYVRRHAEGPADEHELLDALGLTPTA